MVFPDIGHVREKPYPKGVTHTDTSARAYYTKQRYIYRQAQR